MIINTKNQAGKFLPMKSVDERLGAINQKIFECFHLHRIKYQSSLFNRERKVLSLTHSSLISLENNELNALRSTLLSVLGGHRY